MEETSPTSETSEELGSTIQSGPTEEASIFDPETSIDFPCPGCENTLRIPQEHTGDVICPTCNSFFQLTNMDSPGHYDEEIDLSVAGGPEFAMLLGTIFYIYGAIDFLSYFFFDLYFPGPSISPLLAGLIGAGFHRSAPHWVQLNLKSREIAKEIFAVQIGVGSLSILIIVGILFSTLPNDDLVGVWRNDVYTLTLSEDGSATDNNQDFGAIGWYSDSDSLYLAFEDKPDVYYHFIYELEGDILYIALVDESYEVMPDTCSILVKYDTPISVVDDATIPSWCS